jgi:hypothetical protein
MGKNIYAIDREGKWSMPIPEPEATHSIAFLIRSNEDNNHRQVAQFSGGRTFIF